MKTYRTTTSLLWATQLLVATAISAVVFCPSPRWVMAQSSNSTANAKVNPQVQRSLELNERGVLAVRAREFSQAEELFTKALEVDSRNITAVFNLAGMYITNKKEASAVTLLTKYTADFPKDAGLRARLGDALFGSQQPNKAVASYEAALAIDPKYPGVPAKLATLYAMQNKIDKAATMYERAVKANPQDVQSLKNLSSIYLGLGKPQQAVSTAKRALQLSATADVYVTLGNAYQELRDDKNALNAFQRAKELGYKDPNLAKVIEGLTEKTKKGMT
jgi:tetratricopeptide (TPR) repeat protein